MSDFLSKKDRSRLMSRIRSTNTKPEIILRKFLFNEGFRFRIHVKELPGSPDIVLRKYRSVIQMRGCFWHSHNCKFSRIPKTNKLFWTDKLGRNVIRDKKNDRLLRNSGWKSIIVWECQVTSKKRFEKTKGRILKRMIKYKKIIEEKAVE